MAEQTIPVPGVLAGNEYRKRALCGFEKVARLLALTLGPLGGNIVSQRVNRTDAEILSDAATIARRMTELPDPVENVGAMMMRHIVCQMRDSHGDGSATAAVLASVVAREAHRLIAAGVNPMTLRRGIERGTQAAVGALDGLSCPLEGAERIAGLATAAIAEPELGRLLGEMYDYLGPYGTIVVQPYLATRHDRAYQEGTRFPGEYASSYLLSDPVSRVAALDDAYVLVADMHFETVASVLTLVDLVRQAGGRDLFIICKNMWNKAIGALAWSNAQDTVRTYAATIKPVEDLRFHMMQDIALLTGATLLTDAAGITSSDIRLEHLGHAERVVATRDYVMILGGAGNRLAVRDRERKLRTQLRAASQPGEQQLLRERIGRLVGGVGELRVAALTEQERTRLTEKAAHAIKVVQAGVEGGIVPGGGTAYLAAIPAVEAVEAEGDEAMGVRIVARALEEPLRVMADNVQAEAPAVVAACREKGFGYGFEVRQRRVADMLAEQIVDPTVIAREALRCAVSGAMTFMTAESLVLHRRPPQTVKP